MFIAQNQKPSHMSFERFIRNDLTMLIEEYMKDQHIAFIHGKNCRESPIQCLYDELKENALKL